MSMDPKSMARAVSQAFPDHDFPTILGLCEEMKDENKVIDYLREHPDGGWSQEKKKEQRGEKQSYYRGGGQRNFRPKGEKKEKEEQPVAPKPKKTQEFAKSSNAKWGDIKFDSNNEIVKPAAPVETQAPPPIPPQAAHPPPKPEQPKAPEQKPAEPAQKPPQKPAQKPAQNVEPPKETPAQPPKPAESEPPRAKLETTLWIPKSLERVTPQMNKFGVFTGPVQRTPEPVKEVAQPQPQPQQQPQQRKRTELKVGAQQHVLDLPAEQPQPQPQPQAPRPQQQPIEEEQQRKPVPPPSAPQQQPPHEGNMPYPPMQFMPYGMFGWAPYPDPEMYRMSMQMPNPMAQNQAEERARQANTPPGFPPVGFGPPPNGMPYPMYAAPPQANPQQFPREGFRGQPGMYGAYQGQY